MIFSLATIRIAPQGLRAIPLGLGLACLGVALSTGAVSAATEPCELPDELAGSELKEVRKGLKATPLDPELNYQLAAHLIAKERWAQAREPLAIAAERRSDWPDPHLCLATLYGNDNYRVPELLALSRFLTLEDDTLRSLRAARRLVELVTAVETDRAGRVVIRPDLDAPLYEGMLVSADMILQLAVASVIGSLDATQVAFHQEDPELVERMVEWVKGDSAVPEDDFSRMVAVLRRFFSALAPLTPEKPNTFVESNYLPFFAELRSEELTAPFVGTAFSTLGLGGANEWAAENGDAVARYRVWLDPESGPPADGPQVSDPGISDPETDTAPAEREQLTLEDIGMSAAPENPGEDMAWVPIQELMSIMIESELLYETLPLVELDDPSPEAIAELLWGPVQGGVTFPWIELTEAGLHLKAYSCEPETWEALEPAEADFKALRWAKARVAYETIAQSDPNCYVIWSHIGDTYKFEGDREAALPYYDKAIELNPYDYRSYFYKGSTLFGLGQMEEARELIIKSLSLRPRPASVDLFLDHAAERLGLEYRASAFAPRGVAIRDGEVIKTYFDSERAHWMGYAFCKAVWLGEPEFRRQRAGDATEPGVSTPEGVECLLALLESYLNLREGPSEGFEVDPDLELLFEVFQAGLIHEFYFYEIASRRSQDILLLLPEDSGLRVQEYVRRFVAVPVDGG